MCHHIYLYHKHNNMQLSINSDRLISEVQQDFSNAYPFLKIEFFRNGTRNERRHTAHQKIDHNRKLKDSWTLKKEKGQLQLNDSMTVMELENAFMDEFGLSVQVLRKSGNVWLETTMTDNWTLKQQSEHGREISRGHKYMYRPYEDDFDLNRDND